MWLPLREQLLSLVDYGLQLEQLLELGLNEAVVLTCIGDLATPAPNPIVKLEASVEHEASLHPLQPSLVTESLTSRLEADDDLMDISPISPEGDIVVGQLPNRSRSPLHTMTITEVSEGVGAFDADASTAMETEADLGILRPASPDPGASPHTSPERTQLPKTADLMDDQFNSDMEFDDDGDCFQIVDGVWETLRGTGYSRPRPSAAELNGQSSFTPPTISQPPVLFAEVPQNYVIDLSDSEYEEEVSKTVQSSSGTLEKKLLSGTVQERMEELDRQKRELLTKLKAMAAKRKKTIVQSESSLSQPKTIVESQPTSNQPNSVALEPILEEATKAHLPRASPLVTELTTKSEEVPARPALPAPIATSAVPASSFTYKAEANQRKRQLKGELEKEEEALALAQKHAMSLQSELVKMAHALQNAQSTRSATSASLAASRAKLERITQRIKKQETALAALEVVERETAKKITDRKRQLLVQGKRIPGMHQSVNTKRAELLQLDKSIGAFRSDALLPDSHRQSTNIKRASDDEVSLKKGPTKRVKTQPVAFSKPAHPNVLAPAALLTSPPYEADLLRFLQTSMLALDYPEISRLAQDAIPVSFPNAVRDEAVRRALNPPETLIPLMAIDGLLRTEADLASISDVHNSASSWSWTLNGWWNVGKDTHGRNPRLAASSSSHKGSVMTLPYQSNLSRFRSFRVSTECHENVTSLTWSNKVNPLQILCRYEIEGGICHDPLCEGQHERDIKMTDDEITQDLLAYTSIPADSAIAANINDEPSKDNAFEPALPIDATDDFQQPQSDDLVSLSLRHEAIEKNVEAPVIYVASPDSTKASPAGRETTFRPRVPVLIDGFQKILDGDAGKAGRYFQGSISEKEFEILVRQKPKNVDTWITYAVKAIPHHLPPDVITQPGETHLNKALNILSRALQANRTSEPLWSLYLELFCRVSQEPETRETFQQAMGFLPGNTHLQLRWYLWEPTLARKKSVLETIIDQLITENSSSNTGVLLDVVMQLAFEAIQSFFAGTGSDHKCLAVEVPLTVAFRKLSQANLATAWILYFHLCHRGSLPERAFLAYPYNHLTRREFWEISWQTPKVRPASLTDFHLLFYNVVTSWSKNVDMNNLLPFVAVLRNFLNLWTRVLGQQDTLLKLVTAVKPLLQSVELIDLFCVQWELTDDPRISLRGAGLAAQNGHNFGLWNCYTKLAFQFGNPQDVLKALVNCARAAYVGLDEVTDVSPDTTPALVSETLDLYRKLLFLPVSSLRTPDVLPELSRSATKANVFLWINYLLLSSLRPINQDAAVDISAILDHALEAVRDPSGRHVLWMEYIRFQTASKPSNEASTARSPSVRDNLSLIARAAKELELNTNAHPAMTASPSSPFVLPVPWKDTNGLQRLLELLMNAYGKEKRDEVIQMVVDGQLPLGVSPFMAKHAFKSSPRSTAFLTILRKALALGPTSLQVWEIPSLFSSRNTKGNPLLDKILDTYNPLDQLNSASPRRIHKPPTYPDPEQLQHDLFVARGRINELVAERKMAKTQIRALEEVLAKMDARYEELLSINVGRQ
ncbi:Zinc finger C3H1 domain-containing protein [Thoreauomyces humboldtii]|nr:Zinc finger C3H1 domain-containing protein [Thoreauomyces humboldtii]